MRDLDAAWANVRREMAALGALIGRLGEEIERCEAAAGSGQERLHRAGPGVTWRYGIVQCDRCERHWCGWSGEVARCVVCESREVTP